jgi:hypothetical protein
MTTASVGKSRPSAGGTRAVHESGRTYSRLRARQACVLHVYQHPILFFPAHLFYLPRRTEGQLIPLTSPPLI